MGFWFCMRCYIGMDFTCAKMPGPLKWSDHFPHKLSWLVEVHREHGTSVQMIHLLKEHSQTKYMYFVPRENCCWNLQTALVMNASLSSLVKQANHMLNYVIVTCNANTRKLVFLQLLRKTHQSLLAAVERLSAGAKQYWVW